MNIYIRQYSKQVTENNSKGGGGGGEGGGLNPTEDGRCY